ncbi:MAG: ribonuclease III [Desulfocucumaceae bacterium]
MDKLDTAGELYERLGIQWKNNDFLNMAMTHSSVTFDRKDRLNNNQRLEFLGDAVLELIVSDYLYKIFPSCTEGDLTKLRAAIVCEPSLSKVAKKLGLGACLIMGKGEEKSGGRERPSILADSFEALLGAVYLDSGLATATEFALRQLGEVIADVLEGRADRDYKTELQEILQKKNNSPVNYIILQEEGPPHKRFFTAGAIYMGRQLGTGAGHSKKEAEQQAARAALSSGSTDIIDNL